LSVPSLPWLPRGASARLGPVIVTSIRTSCPPAGYRFPRDVIAVAVRWYLGYGLSYRDVEELLAERGVTVDHLAVYRWVQTFTPEFVDAARAARHLPVIAGSSTKRVSRSPAAGTACVARSTRLAKGST
jgi:hypothetical protein